MAEYIDAKANIFRFQNKSDLLVLNADNEITDGFASQAAGTVKMFSFRTKPDGDSVFFEDGQVKRMDKNGAIEIILNRSELKLRGDHNVENFMAAVAAVSDYCDIETIREVARTFGGVRHRMEFIREIGGVSFYNDSIGSSPTRTIATLHSFEKKVRLIAGGYDKKIPYDALAPAVLERVEKLYLCGVTAPKIRDAVLGLDPTFPYEMYDDLKSAIEAAYADAKKGNIVLLSPASASFDQFKNFEERGDYFVSVVKGLK